LFLSTSVSFKISDSLGLEKFLKLRRRGKKKYLKSKSFEMENFAAAFHFIGKI
jgi:hypothetical protein